MTSLYVQYGCGFSAPDGWMNFDASPTLRLERLPIVGQLVQRNAARFPPNVRPGNIVRGLPLADKSAAGVYASHVLEHLSHQEFGLALANTLRIMSPGAHFRLIVPDLRARAEKYLAELAAGETSANDKFLRTTYLGQDRRPRSIGDFARSWIGNSAHLWMWDEPSMTAALKRTGFVSIRRCTFNDSNDPMFKRVENSDRFFDPAEQITELAMEARKPA